MKQSSEREFLESVLKHPFLQRLSALGSKMTGLGLLVVFPKSDGWGQVRLTVSALNPDFCRAIQQSKDGARHCRTCHILMTVAACSRKEATEQTCHAGAHTFAAPASMTGGDCLAILSSCVFASAESSTEWPKIRERGRQLGADLEALQEAYDKLPRLTAEELAAARDFMAAVGDAVSVLAGRAASELELAELQQNRKSGPRVHEVVETGLRTRARASACCPRPAAGDRSHMPGVVRVVANLVDRTPNMPFNVAEVAAAARMSPNHFSSLFRQHVGKNFSAYLTQRRIDLACELLGDLTLNVTEVAHRSGYDDPGYFARRFRQTTGMTPRAWRASHAPAPATGTP